MNPRSNLFKVITAAVIVVLLVCFTAGCTTTNSTDSGLTITNSDGTTTTLPGEAQRIVLLNSNAGEILYLLGESDRVVGISQSIANNKEQRAMYPDALVVGTWDQPDVEYLISQNVDLVIGYATSKPKNAEVLAASGIPIVYLDCTKPATMASDIKEVGKIAGNEAKATEVADFYTDIMDKITAEAKNYSSQPSIYAESYTAYYGQGEGTGIGQMIDLTGGKNIMESINGARKISDEWVVTEKPEIIIKLVNSMEGKENVLKEITGRTGFDQIPAVQNNKVWLIRNDLTYGPRACVGALAILKMQHPDALPDMTPESVLEEFNTKFGSSFDTTNITYPSL